jgi:hypothetical protein
VLNVKPLLETLSKVSDGRVLNCAEMKEEGTLCQIKIPVQEVNPGDKTDKALRRYASDWLKLRKKDIGVEAKFELLQAGITWDDDNGTCIPVAAAITVSWWPRPPVPELEQYRKDRKTQTPKS